MEERILEVILQIKAIKSKPGPRKYPEPLRQEIIELYIISKRRLALSKRLGVGTSTISNWRRSNRVPTGTANVNFKSISVFNKFTDSPRLIFSNGIFVENLSEEFLFRMISRAISK